MINQILNKIDWPIDTLLLDFETYFDKDYHLSKGKNALSIVEYVTSPQFKLTGLGLQINDKPPRFIPGPYIDWAIEQLKKKYGKALHNCTLVAKNNKFDCLILVEKFNIFPPYTIDVEDLSRYYDSRMKQGLKDLSKLFKLPAKGDTNQFKGLYWETMSPEQRQAMREYCLGDITNEKSLLEILLPKLDNPGIELDLARHTLNLYLKPPFKFDFDLANKIEIEMNQELVNTLDGVDWILDYAS